MDTPARKNDELSVFVDASWGSDMERMRKSRTEFLIMYGKARVYATSSLRKRVALRSTRIYYIALLEASKTIISFEHVLSELEVRRGSTEVCQDN